MPSDASLTDQLGQDLYAALDAQDWPRIRQLVAEHAVIQVGSHPPIGFDHWRSNQRQFYVAFSEARHVFDDRIICGNRLITRGRFEGTHADVFAGVPPSGRRVSAGVIHVDRFHNGQLVEHHGQLDVLGLMRQIGAI